MRWNALVNLRFNEDGVTQISEDLECPMYKLLAAVPNAAAPILVPANTMNSHLELFEPLVGPLACCNPRRAKMGKMTHLNQFGMTTW